MLIVMMVVVLMEVVLTHSLVTSPQLRDVMMGAVIILV
jgi:hypothetical protein